jgi:hypothetical protein
VFGQRTTCLKECLQIASRARHPGARPTISRASDLDHSKESDKNQGATRLQVPPRISRAGNLSGSKDSGKVQNATRLQLPQSNDISLGQQVEREQRASQ